MSIKQSGFCIRWPVGKALGVADTDVSNAAVAVVDQAAALDGTAIGQCLLQGIQHEDGVSCAAQAPADHAARVGVVRTSRPRTAPCRPILRIRRATVHRATSFPYRPSWRHTLRTP